MHQMLVIADDLSGAADCGVACASSGLDAVVVLGDAAGELDADVLSVDADTRRRAPSAAAEETTRLLHRFLNGEHQLVFKKLDSTLRGNVAAELAAVLEVRQRLVPNKRIVAVLAPAFPASGRTTVNGRQLVDGKPIEETEFWPRLRMEHGNHSSTQICSQIDEALAAAGMRAALVNLKEIRLSEDLLARVMGRRVEDADVLICDAETDLDLQAIANASMALGRATVWAGAAGLAYHLPRAAGLTAGPLAQQKPVKRLELASGPTLFAIGSRSSVSRRQVEELTTFGDLVRITIAPESLVAGEMQLPTRRQTRRLEEALNAGRDVLVVTGMESAFDAGTEPQLSAALAALVAPHVRKLGGLVASGGETARAVLQACGVIALRLIGELEPGLPFSVTENWSERLPVLTKAGGFGQPQTLLRCQRSLRELDRNSYPTPRKSQAEGG